LERASLISGTCSILSQPGQGTTVMLTVPLQSEADDD
jgi:signal transduction histidine kinase